MTIAKETTEDSGFQFTARHLALILVVIGLVISGYLSYVKLLDVPIICVEGEQFSCTAVESSKWSTFQGIPVAYLGFAGYLFIGAVLLLEKRIAFLEDNGRLILFIIALFGWMYSMWLVYVQAVIILAFCQWCLAHEFNFTILFGVILYMLWQDLRG